MSLCITIYRRFYSVSALADCLHSSPSQSNMNQVDKVLLWATSRIGPQANWFPQVPCFDACSNKRNILQDDSSYLSFYALLFLKVHHLIL